MVAFIVVTVVMLIITAVIAAGSDELTGEGAAKGWILLVVLSAIVGGIVSVVGS